MDGEKVLIEDDEEEECSPGPSPPLTPEAATAAVLPKPIPRVPKGVTSVYYSLSHNGRDEIPLRKPFPYPPDAFDPLVKIGGFLLGIGLAYCAVKCVHMLGSFIFKGPADAAACSACTDTAVTNLSASVGATVS